MDICACDHVPQVRFDEMVPYVAVNVDGVPANVIGHNLRLAAIELATKAKLMRRTLWIDMQECVSVYGVRLTDCYSIMSISQVCCGSQKLRPARDLQCCPTESCSYYFERPDKLYVGASVAEDSERTLEIHARVLPGQDSCSIDEWVYQLYAEAISEGAMYRILKMPGEDWYNPQLAVAHGRNFNAAVADAVLQDRTANSGEPTVMKTPRGFLI